MHQLRALWRDWLVQGSRILQSGRQQIAYQAAGSMPLREALSTYKYLSRGKAPSADLHYQDISAEGSSFSMANCQECQGHMLHMPPTPPSRNRGLVAAQRH